MGTPYQCFSTRTCSLGVYELVLLEFLFVPSYQHSACHASERKMLQTWYYREITHPHSGNPLLDRLSLNLPRVIFPNIILQCTANRASIQVPILLVMVQDTYVMTCMDLLDHQSQRANNIFRLNFEGRMLSSGNMFFTIFSSSSNPLSETPFVALHCNNSSVLRSFL